VHGLHGVEVLFDWRSRVVGLYLHTNRQALGKELAGDIVLLTFSKLDPFGVVAVVLDVLVVTPCVPAAALSDHGSLGLIKGDVVGVERSCAELKGAGVTAGDVEAVLSGSRSLEPASDRVSRVKVKYLKG
jgi:hypothetical protein